MFVDVDGTRVRVTKTTSGFEWSATVGMKRLKGGPLPTQEEAIAAAHDRIDPVTQREGEGYSPTRLEIVQEGIRIRAAHMQAKRDGKLKTGGGRGK